MTSQEIAEQIAQQNQFFMGQYAMATQIGVNPMAFGGGMGASGIGAGTAPAMPQHPGGPAMPGAFNYGANPFYGYGSGNRLGAIGFGAASAAPTIGLTGLELFSMTKGGAGLAPFVNPMSAFGAARAAGFGMMGAGALAGAAMLPAMAVQHAVGNVVSGAHQQSMVNTALGQYNFINPASRSGTGFTRDDAAAIGSQMRQLAMVPEMMTSMQELTRMLPSLKASGVMQGVRDAYEFNRRFKEAITTIRDISKVIGSTMEEAGQFFQHSARVGFFGRSDQLRNAVQAQVVTGTTGMTQQQFMQLQQGMADFGTATGAGRATMARAAGNIATNIGLAQQSGVIRQGQLEDLTGKVGGEAVADASMRMANLSTRLAASGLGRFEMLGAMVMGPDGKPHIDRNALQRHSMTELRQRGMRASGNRQNVIAFEAHQGRLAGEFTEAGGLQATFGMMQNLVGQYGDQAPELLMQQYGATEQEAELARSIYQAGSGGARGAQNVVAGIRQRQAALRERADPRAVFRRISTSVGNKISQPVQQFGAELWTSITKGVDNFIDDMVGNYVVTASEEAQKKYIQAFTSGDKGALKELFGGGGQLPAGTPGSALGALARLSSPGGAAAMAFSGTTAGQDMGALTRWFRNSAVGNWFSSIGTNTTGRQVETQFRDNASLLGLKGLDINKQSDRAALERGVRQLAGTTATTEEQRKAAAFAAEVQRGLMNDEEYMNATSEKKLDMLRSRLQAMDMPMDESGITQASAAGVNLQAFGGGGVDSYAAAIAAAQGQFKGKSRLDMMSAMGGGTGMYLDIASVAINFRDAEDKLRKNFGADTANAIKSQPAIRDALSFIAGVTDPQKKQELLDALKSGDVGQLYEASGGKVKLTQDQVGYARDAWLKVEKGDASLGDVTDYTRAASNKDRAAFISSYQESANNAAEAGKALEKSSPEYAAQMQKVAGSYREAAKALQEGNFEAYQKAMNQGTEATESAVDLIMGAQGDKRDEMLQGATESVRAAYERKAGTRDVLSRHRGQRMTAAQLAKELNLSEAEITKKFGTSSITLNATATAELEHMASRRGQAEAVAAGAAEQRQKTKDDQTIITLKAIAEAVISANADKINKGKVEGRAGELLRQVQGGNANP